MVLFPLSHTALTQYERSIYDFGGAQYDKYHKELGTISPKTLAPLTFCSLVPARITTQFEARLGSF